MATTTAHRRLRRIASVLGAALLAPALIAGAAQTASAAEPKSTYGGNVRYEWEIPDAPKSGMTSLSMPITIHKDSAHVKSSYVSTEYSFTGQDNVGYMGLQPRADSAQGSARMLAVFSSFVPGTTSTDENCRDGADGGAGLSCSFEFDAVPGRTYEVEVKKTGKDTWTGTAVDTVKGERIHIGTYTLPAGSGKLENSQTGFVENFSNPSKTCEGVQRIDVTIGRPHTGNIQGRADAPSEYGNCVDQANYSSSVKGGQVRITRGWL